MINNIILCNDAEAKRRFRPILYVINEEKAVLAPLHNMVAVARRGAPQRICGAWVLVAKLLRRRASNSLRRLRGLCEREGGCIVEVFFRDRCLC